MERLSENQDKQAPLSASKLIFEHKQKLAQERARKVIMDRERKDIPQLGKGLTRGKPDFPSTLSVVS